MIKKWYLGISIVIVLIAATLRLYNFSARAPFDWDQNRDYLAVSKIASGNATLVGPVAKGDGGFLLGPLYYYLVLPAFSIMKSSPLALPITSIVLDLLAVTAILVLLRKSLGDWGAIAMGAVYTTSFVFIETSRVSWNVAIVPLYCVVILSILSNDVRLSAWRSLVYGIIAGLTWHIHAALIPLVIILLGIKFLLSKPTWSYLFYFVLGYLVALSPLFIFDLRHAGLERHLIIEFLKSSSKITPAWGEIIVSVFSRFGKNLYAVLSGYSDLSMSLGTVGTFLVILTTIKKTSIRYIAYGILLNLALALALRESGFPEYYLQFATIATLYLLIYFIRRYLSLATTFILIAIYVMVQSQSYTYIPSPFALQQKLSLTQKIASYHTPYKLLTNLPYGRDFGFESLFKYVGIKESSDSPVTFLLTESHDETLFIDGEIAQDLGYYGGFRLGVRGVQ